MIASKFSFYYSKYDLTPFSQPSCYFYFPPKKMVQIKKTKQNSFKDSIRSMLLVMLYTVMKEYTCWKNVHNIWLY